MRSQIAGLKKLNQRLTTQDFMQKPSGAFLRDWREDLRREAIDRAPIGVTHGIINALQTAQDTSRWPLYARVFIEAPQARWSEYGTGELSEDPRSSRTAYFPSIEGIRDWAESKGHDPYIVARGIFERGGTPPTHFFSDAERAADASMIQRLSRFGKHIEREAARG